MSRRKFMKAIAGGGAALGAAAMMPSAAALDIESDNPLRYNENFSVDTQGNLNLQGKDATNVGSVNALSVSSEEGSIGKLWPDSGGTAVVSPSYSECFDSIQSAFDAGYRYIWLAEDITENNILIPNGWGHIVIRGMGGPDGRPCITDPETGDPVFYTDTTEDDTVKVTMADFRIEGGANSGPSIDARRDQYLTSGWELNNIEIHGGPVLLQGSFRTTVNNCDVENISDISYTVFGKSGVYPSLVHDGATFGMWGGTFATTRGEDNVMLSSAAFTINGGCTFHNKSSVSDSDRANLTFHGSARGAIQGFSCEGSGIDIRFGASEDQVALQNSVISAASLGGASGETVFEVNRPIGDVTVFNPNTDIRIEKDGSFSRADMVIYGAKGVEVNGPNPHDVTVIKTALDGSYKVTSPDNAGYTQFFPDIVSQSPGNSGNPAEGGIIIPDGTNWDPLGVGEKWLTQYDGNKWRSVVPVTQTSLGGTSPDPTNYGQMVFVEDSDNPGTMYLITPSGNAIQIGSTS